MRAGFPEQVYPAYSQPDQTLLRLPKLNISPTALGNSIKYKSCNFSHRIVVTPVSCIFLLVCFGKETNLI